MRVSTRLVLGFASPSPTKPPRPGKMSGPLPVLPIRGRLGQVPELGAHQTTQGRRRGLPEHAVEDSRV